MSLNPNTVILAHEAAMASPRTPIERMAVTVRGQLHEALSTSVPHSHLVSSCIQVTSSIRSGSGGLQPDLWRQDINELLALYGAWERI